MRAVRWLLGLTLVAACGTAPTVSEATTTSTTLPATTASTSPATTTTEVRDLIISGDLTVIVPPDADGDYSPDQLVSCSDVVFPFGALEEIRPLSDDDPIRAGIEGFLSDEEGQFWPQEGWHVLYQADDAAHLVALAGDGSMAHMTVDWTDGEWRWSGASLGEACEIEYATPPALGRVDWRLDPAWDGPTPESTTLEVLVTERACASGQPIGDRLVGPQVVMTPTEVRVAFAARPLTGPQECPSNPETPVTVELPVGLGQREVVVGLALGIELADYLG